MTVRPNICKHFDQFRNAVNDPDIQRLMLQDLTSCKQLCSCMDVIGDTDEAISFYLSCPPTEDMGGLYLQTYGILQVLFVQQDALINAAEAVGLDYDPPDELMHIRIIRNKATVHPTKRGNKNPQSFGIIQCTLSHESFQLCSFDWDDPDELEPIIVSELIAT
jgi:hypothetical protein